MPQKWWNRQDLEAFMFGKGDQPDFFEAGFDRLGFLEIEVNERLVWRPRFGGFFDQGLCSFFSVAFGGLGKEVFVPRDLMEANRSCLGKREIQSELFTDEELKTLPADCKPSFRAW